MSSVVSRPSEAVFLLPSVSLKPQGSDPPSGGVGPQRAGGRPNAAEDVLREATPAIINPIVILRDPMGRFLNQPEQALLFCGGSKQ